MAVTTLPSDSSVESVKLAVRSTTTCSNATVLSLQGLFRGSSKTPPEPESNTTSRRTGRSTKESTATAASRATTARGARSKLSAKDITLNSVAENDGARLSGHERLILATEVFNTTLKTLSDAVKLSTSKRQISSSTDEAPSASTPLQPATQNHAAKSPRKSKLSKYTQSDVSAVDKGLLAVAECARSALSCLRTLKSEQGAQESQGPNMQLEQGACVLAGRLLSLGLNDLAYKELRALKRRIQSYLDTVNTNSRKATGGTKKKDSQDEEAAKERMSDLLTFTHIANAKLLLGLLVTFQSNALRLIASEKRPSTTQKVASSLQLSDSSSPANVIMTAVESGCLTKDKAALQLQLLSNTVLSLSQQQSDSVMATTKDTWRPLTSLNLQLLSLEVRSMGWKLSGHLCDEGKEVWDPLARYLAGFANHSKGIEKSDFALMYKTIVRLQSAITKTERKSSSSPRDTHSVARIATILGQLAQDADCLEEALKLFTEALAPLSDGQCLSLATVRCKIASLHFQRLKSSNKSPETDIASAVSEASAALGLQLKGSANDLDELLVEGAKLKKISMAWLGDVVTKDRNVKEKEVPSRIREYLQGFLRFLRRYIGRQPSEDSESKEQEFFKKRVGASKSIILAAIDSAVAMGKLSVMSQSPPWEEVLTILVDCQRLLTTMGSAFQDSDSGVEDCEMGFVKLSNLFWSRYIKEKESSQDYRVLVPLLKQSTALLSTCSPSQRNTGFAALKYERIAHLYSDGDMGAESNKAFCQSIKEHIDAGALEQVASDATGNYPHRISQDPKSAGFMLGRAISGYLRMKLRNKTSEAQNMFDDDQMKLEERGLVLEWQMGILTELYAHAYSDELFRSTFSCLLTKLLDVYPSHIYPVRRMRAILCAMRFSLERPSSLEPQLVQKIADEGMDVDNGREFGNDYTLAPYAKHIRNALRLTIGLHQGNLQPAELDRIISSWTSMARDCHDWKSLGSCVLDVDYWLLQLRAVVDYTEIHGLWKVQLSALELVLRITELQESGDFSEAIVVLSRLVLQYCRLGHCKKASSLLSRADQCVRDNEVSCLATLSYKLARVEYLLETGDIEKAASILSSARVLYEKNQKQHDLKNCSVLSKMSWERLVADAAFINSRLSFAQGSITHALFFAKLSVRLNCRIWAKVEKLAQRKQGKALQASNGSEMDSVVEGVAKLDVSQTTSSDAPVSYFQGAPFWPHIGSHHTSLLNLASLSAHHGLFQDAIYYGEQALKVNKTLNANVRLVASQTQLGSHWIFGGRMSEGQELLESAAALSKQLDSSIEIVSLQMGLASLHRAQGHYRDEHRALLEADKVMSDVVHSETASSASTVVSELEDKMDKLRIRGGSRRTPQATTTRRTRATSSSARNAPKASNPVVETPAIESKSLLHLRTDLLRHQADCSRALRDFEKATGLLSDARQYALSRDSQISLHIGESEHLLADAIRHFATHAVYCVLPESTISLPSLESPKKGADEGTAVSAKPSTVRRTRAPTRGTRSKAPKANEDFSVMLSKAGESLNNVFATATTLGSTLDSHAASRLMSRISMLSQTTAPGCSTPWSHAPANVNEIGRIGAFNRERMAIDLDKQLADFSDPLLWPTSSMSTVELEEDLCSNFTKDYVDILPENWNVLSLSLSADCTEFVVSRLHKGHTPFLLRLPLKRGNSDEDDEQFTFEDGREEMQELIKLANESAHAAKAQVDKQMKKQWWKNREALDRRMENLLQNIENVWFGGFRGIFSPVPQEGAALSRFASSFHAILDNHLPSRQKGGRSTAGPKLTLHRNVLELFIGIQDLEAQEDPEETLMDLLYFVVDILQFQGERNAYDEIDFDMMVVDTLDALRGYHEAVRNESAEQQTSHTVLVLDKSLHLFPWESLPSLQGSPVCRVPSLECLRDRVLRFRCEQGRLGIDRKNGTYILNPTGDLQTTQGTFEQDLSRLDGWTGVVNRQPNEDEFRDALETKSLFLYFGHGSGAQYIRGRTVKRMDQCAVAFLMGCSSGTLTEAGEYEPYGTPMNYLQAGSPALVATLWDVTDKDIDRFAHATFERWGLIGGDEGASSSSSSSSKKGKSRASRSSPVALDEAVNQSRSACVLKYLNGAAPVIYGVPSVFLE